MPNLVMADLLVDVTDADAIFAAAVPHAFYSVPLAMKGADASVCGVNKNSTVGECMTQMVHTVGTEQTITFAMEHMRENQIRHLPVLRGGRLVGVVSDRDLGLIAGLNDVNPDNTKVEEAMTAVPYTATSDTPLTEVLAQMTEHKYGSVVIMDGSKVAGIFTTYDVVLLLTKSLLG